MTDLDKRIDAYLALADAAPKGPYRKHGASIYCDETEDQPCGRIALCEGDKYWRPKTAAFIAASHDAAKIIRELRAERDALIHDMEQFRQVANAESKCADELKAKRDELQQTNGTASSPTLMERGMTFEKWWHQQMPNLVSGEEKSDRAIARAAWAARDCEIERLRDALVRVRPWFSTETMMGRGMLKVVDEALQLGATAKAARAQENNNAR